MSRRRRQHLLLRSHRNSPPVFCQRHRQIITMNTMTIVLFVAVAIAAVSAQVVKPVVPILQHDEVRDEVGQFTLRYLSGDGTSVVESGKLIPNDEGDGHVLVKEGSYTFSDPKGKSYTVEYVADKNGFQPKGAHLPVAPVA